jgi:hypothetical protein
MGSHGVMGSDLNGLLPKLTFLRKEAQGSGLHSTLNGLCRRDPIASPEKIVSSLALKKQSAALLETAKYAVEIAIEQDEKAGMAYIEEIYDVGGYKLYIPT